jgi:hypothetical protein
MHLLSNVVSLWIGVGAGGVIVYEIVRHWDEICATFNGDDYEPFD